MTGPAHRTLGRTGLSVSEIGLGCWQLGGDWGAQAASQADAVLQAATDHGISFWDTADVYGGGVSESIIGEYNRRDPDGSRVIATKVGRTPELYAEGYTREKLEKAIDACRRRLQTDQLDLVQLHCIPMEEMRKGDIFDWLEACRERGWIRHYGASVETVEDALFCISNTGVESLQLICNLLRQDMAETVFPRAAAADIGVIVRLGLASGLLSGTMVPNQTFAEDDQRHFNRDGQAFYVGETFAGLPFNTGVSLAEELKTWCPEGMTLPQMALRWLLDQPGVTTIIAGASKPEQVERNAAVSALPSLPESLHSELRDFYHQRVRQHIRGEI